MTEPGILIELDQTRVACVGTVSGRVRWPHFEPDAIRAGEIVVLWYTEGKGDMDSQVVHREPLAPRGMDEQRFSTQLPGLPVTYYGHLLKVHWVVRVRLDMQRGKDVVEDREFEVVASIDLSGG